MNSDEVKKLWDENAEAWTALSRLGYDSFRNSFNTPAFFEILPEVTGLKGLDIGCGEGHNTRILAGCGAIMTGLDISDKFIEYAASKEDKDKLGVKYLTANALNLPFNDNTFDFATSFMCFMDTPDPDKAIAEAYRVLKPGGFLQFSIAHPCFNTPNSQFLRNEKGYAYACAVLNYFSDTNGKIEEWTFSTVSDELKARYPKFKVPRFSRPLNLWFKYLLSVGFQIEAIEEPFPSREVVEKYPNLQPAQAIPFFLHIRTRRPCSNCKNI